MTAGEQLDKLGIKSSDIDYVVTSHLDCDPADGLRQFKDAMVARSEYERSISIFVLIPDEYNFSSFCIIISIS